MKLERGALCRREGVQRRRRACVRWPFRCIAVVPVHRRGAHCFHCFFFLFLGVSARSSMRGRARATHLSLSLSLPAPAESLLLFYFFFLFFVSLARTLSPAVFSTAKLRATYFSFFGVRRANTYTRTYAAKQWLLLHRCARAYIYTSTAARARSVPKIKTKKNIIHARLAITKTPPACTLRHPMNEGNCRARASLSPSSISLSRRAARLPAPLFPTFHRLQRRPAITACLRVVRRHSNASTYTHTHTYAQKNLVPRAKAASCK